MKLSGWVVALVLAGGCSKSDSSGAKGSGGGGGGDTVEKSYKLSIVADKINKIEVTVKIPTAWKEEVDDKGIPTFQLADGPSHFPSVVLTAIGPSGTDQERMAKAISLQYDKDELATAKREDKPDGRVWIDQKKDDRVHSRMFVPAKDGIVMCVIMMMGDTAQFPAAAAACDSVRVK